MAANSASDIEDPSDVIVVDVAVSDPEPEPEPEPEPKLCPSLAVLSSTWCRSCLPSDGTEKVFTAVGEPPWWVVPAVWAAAVWAASVPLPSLEFPSEDLGTSPGERCARCTHKAGDGDFRCCSRFSPSFSSFEACGRRMRPSSTTALTFLSRLLPWLLLLMLLVLPMPLLPFLPLLWFVSLLPLLLLFCRRLVGVCSRLPVKKVLAPSNDTAVSVGVAVGLVRLLCEGVLAWLAVLGLLAWSVRLLSWFGGLPRLDGLPRPFARLVGLLLLRRLLLLLRLRRSLLRIAASTSSDLAASCCRFAAVAADAAEIRSTDSRCCCCITVTTCAKSLCTRLTADVPRASASTAIF